MRDRFRAGRRLAILSGFGFLVLLMALNIADEWHRRAARATVKRTPLQFVFKAPGAVPVEIPEPQKAQRGGVFGFVRDLRAEPIAGAWLAVLDPGERWLATEGASTAARVVRSARDGSYSFAAEVVRTHPDAAVHARHERFLATAVPLAGAREGRLDVILGDGLAIRGRVVSPSPMRAGIPGVRVVARGVGASASAGEEGRFWNARIAVQRARTDPDGSFLFLGLPPGGYQIDLAEVGAVTVPDTRDLESSPAGANRGVIVAAGAVDVTLEMLPVAVALVRLVDQTNGATLGGARVTPQIRPDALLADTGPFRIVLSDGQTWDLRASTLPQGAYAFLVLSERWPVPDDESLRCDISAKGYASRSISIPLRPVGSTKEIEPTVIGLAPLRRTGRVRFRLMTKLGKPVPHCAISFMARHKDPLVGIRWVRSAFNQSGTSEAVSLPVGSYAIVNDPRDPHGRVRPREFESVAGRLQTIALRIASAGFYVGVVDEHGAPLDDVGILAAPGRGEVVPRWVWREEQRALERVGTFLVAPGSGRVPPKTYLVADAGLWTVELYRHGYAPARVELQLSPGEIATREVVMRESPSGRWDTWSRNDGSDLASVKPGRGGD